MAAPAHVQACRRRVLNALFAVGVIAVVIALAGKLYRRSRGRHHARGVHPGDRRLYYLTQTSFRGAIWHSYGYRLVGGARGARVCRGGRRRPWRRPASL
jgi:hypothetical protein